MNNKIIYKEESYSIQGAVFEVYKEKGCGFLENVYQECLEKEFLAQRIPFKSQIYCLQWALPCNCLCRA